MTAKVGLAVYSSARGGFVGALQEANDLLAAGHEVHLLAPEPELPLPSGIRHTAIRAESSAFGVIFAIRRWARSHQFDLIHLHGRAAGILGRVAIARGSVAYTPHGVFRRRNVVANAAEAVLQRALRARTDVVVAVGESEADDYRTFYGIGDVPIVILPNVVDPLEVRRRAASVPPTIAPGVLVPGAFHPQKRFADVIAAVAMAPPDVFVTFVGNTSWDGGRHRDELKRLAERLGVGDQVELGTEMKHLPAELLAAELVLFPSGEEGRPFTALETLALGCPVAYTDIPAHIEVFGSSGARFSPGDVPGIAAVLTERELWRDARPDRSRADDLYATDSAARVAAISLLTSMFTLSPASAPARPPRRPWSRRRR